MPASDAFDETKVAALPEEDPDDEIAPPTPAIVIPEPASEAPSVLLTPMVVPEKLLVSATDTTATTPSGMVLPFNPVARQV